MKTIKYRGEQYNLVDENTAGTGIILTATREDLYLKEILQVIRFSDGDVECELVYLNEFQLQKVMKPTAVTADFIRA